MAGNVCLESPCVREWRNRDGRYFAIACYVAITGSLSLPWYELTDPLTGASLKKDVAWTAET
jgi:hypothetical protein